jgi:hypothetical protein
MHENTEIAELYNKISKASDKINMNAKHICQLKIDILWLQNYAQDLECLIEQYKKLLDEKSY